MGQFTHRADTNLIDAHVNANILCGHLCQAGRSDGNSPN